MKIIVRAKADEDLDSREITRARRPK